MLKWFIVIAGVLFNAAASVVAKTAPPISLAAPLDNFGNWRLILAVVLYGGAFLIYTAALQQLPLNVAHPVSTAGAIVLVGLASSLLFSEAFSPLRVGGYVLLVAGTCLLVLSEIGRAA